MEATQQPPKPRPGKHAPAVPGCGVMAASGDLCALNSARTVHRGCPGWEEAPGLGGGPRAGRRPPGLGGGPRAQTSALLAWQLASRCSCSRSTPASVSTQSTCLCKWSVHTEVKYNNMGLKQANGAVHSFPAFIRFLKES